MLIFLDKLTPANRQVALRAAHLFLFPIYLKLISIIDPINFALSVWVSFGWSHEANTLFLAAVNQ